MRKWSCDKSSKNNKQRAFEIMKKNTSSYAYLFPKKKMRPALRYHGGKWRIAPWIISHFPEHTTYTEVYGGGGSVLLRKPRSYAEIYNDLDGEIVNVFKVLRDRGEEIKKKLKLTPFSRTEFVEAYLPSKDPVERARRTFIKSAMGFGSDGIKNNTGFRSYAKKERYTTPATDWANFMDCVDFFIERLQGVIIENKDAIELLKKQDSKDTLHYVDPPYVHITRSSKNPKQYRFEMSDEEHRKLSEALHKMKGKVILSGYDCALYEELYKDWRKESVEALADGARKRIETLWFNF